MGEVLDRAFKALKTLPEQERERIAWEIIERVEDKTEWDKIISTDTAQDWLEKASAKALKEYTKVADKLAMKFISLNMDNVLREGSYWETFDDLPIDVKKLAEKNYKLWKESKNSPGLRFKQIHKTLPIYSFRVGMKHRTVGVETDDDKIAWFWVGSFETFNKTIGE
ncbi:MAG: hypothetical protein KAR80_01960 [Rhodospirillaceae bacterium]|nr:hypothetical protein [Rhodospirillaceae bacterium]MCK5167467.1 hypothetical protein [Rhodospirillaceae bacterium]